MKMFNVKCSFQVTHISFNLNMGTSTIEGYFCPFGKTPFNSERHVILIPIKLSKETIEYLDKDIQNQIGEIIQNRNEGI